MYLLTHIASFAIATSLVVGTVACGEKKAADPNVLDKKADNSPAGQLASLAKEACECKDMACMKDVRKKWRDLEKSLSKKYPKKEDAPSDLIAAFVDHSKAIQECRTKLRAAEKKMGGGGGASSAACVAAEKKFRAAKASDAEGFRTAMMKVMTTCGGACSAGDKASCGTLDGFMKSLCKVSPSICTSLCKALKNPATKGAACKYAP